MQPSQSGAGCPAYLQQLMALLDLHDHSVCGKSTKSLAKGCTVAILTNQQVQASFRQYHYTAFALLKYCVKGSHKAVKG